MDKANKKSEYNDFLNNATIRDKEIINLKYITGDGVSQSRDNTQRFGLWGMLKGLLIGQWTINPEFRKNISAPGKLYGGNVDKLSEKVGIGARTEAHEIMQGMSGSTIDYFTWVLYKLLKFKNPDIDFQKNHAITEVDLAHAARIFEVNYASWLGLSPTSLFHTQHESLSVLTEFVVGEHLVNDIVCPFRDVDDFNNLCTARIYEHAVTNSVENEVWFLSYKKPIKHLEQVANAVLDVAKSKSQDNIQNTTKFKSKNKAARSEYEHMNEHNKTVCNQLPESNIHFASRKMH